MLEVKKEGQGGKNPFFCKKLLTRPLITVHVWQERVIEILTSQPTIQWILRRIFYAYMKVL